MPTLLSEIITPAEAAALFSISTSAVRQACQRGNIPARKSGSTWLMSRADAIIYWGTPEQRAEHLQTIQRQTWQLMYGDQVAATVEKILAEKATIDQLMTQKMEAIRANQLETFANIEAALDEAHARSTLHGQWLAEQLLKNF